MEVLLNDNLEFSRTIDGKYEKVKLPHSLNFEHGFYHLVFPYSQSFKNKRLFIELSDEDNILYLNKKKISNKTEITKNLKKRENELLIETSHSFKGDVILHVLDQTFIENIDIKQSYDEGFNIKCFITLNGEIKGDETIDVFLYDNEELLYKTSFSALLKEYSFNVGDKEAWERSNPKLYKLVFKLDNDEYNIDIGFRYLKVSEDNLLFNDHKQKFLAAYYDWHYPNSLSNLSSSLFEYDLKKINKCGINALIVKEYNEILFKLCDINGFIIISEGDIKTKAYHPCVLIKKEDEFKAIDNNSVIDNTNLTNNPSLQAYLNYKKQDQGLYLIDNIIGKDGIFDIYRNKQNQIYDALSIFDLNNKVALIGEYEEASLYYKNELIYSDTFEDDCVLVNDITFLIMKQKEDLDDDVYNDLRKLFFVFDNNYELSIIDKLRILKLNLIKKLSKEDIDYLYKTYSNIILKKEDFTLKLKGENNTYQSYLDASKLRISASTNELSLSNDIALVHIEALDENDNVAKDYNDILKISTNGKAQILGNDTIMLNNGSCSFLVKALKTPKAIIEVSALNLAKKETIELKITK